MIPRNTPWRIAVLAALVTLVVALPAAWAGMVPLSLEQLTEHSRRIVVGTVENVGDGYRVQWPGVGRMVCHDVTLKVEANWKGDGPRNLVLQIPGGELRDRGIRVECSEAPKFRRGEKVLVFTAPYMGREHVYSWLQGKYTIFGQRVLGKRGFGVSEVVNLRTLQRRIQRLLEKED